MNNLKKVKLGNIEFGGNKLVIIAGPCAIENEYILFKTAEKLKSYLMDSEVVKKWEGSHLQDPLSLRCIPQLHGAAKRILKDAWEVVFCEINSCGDNPVVYGSEDEPDIYSNGNPDASYVGMERKCLRGEMPAFWMRIFPVCPPSWLRIRG